MEKNISKSIFPSNFDRTKAVHLKKILTPLAGSVWSLDGILVRIDEILEAPQSITKSEVELIAEIFEAMDNI